MFIITIRETRVQEKVRGKDWRVVGKDENKDDKYGYTPEITKSVEVDTQVFEQSVDNLDLVKVVKAINGID